MLKIRLSRTGKKSQPSFRILVQEHSMAVKGGKFVEIVGHYHPATPKKELVIKKDRIEYWISKGAQPSDTVASMLKREGFQGMDKYIGRRDLQAKKKKEVPVEEPAAPAPSQEAAPAEQAEAPVEPVTEEAASEAPQEDASKAEVPAEEKSEEAPKEEKAEEPQKEEPVEEKPEEPQDALEEPKEEEAPQEDAK